MLPAAQAYTRHDYHLLLLVASSLYYGMQPSIVCNIDAYAAIYSEQWCYKIMLDV